MTQRRVIVVGDIMLDQYIRCQVSRIDQTAPVPVCKRLSTSSCLGGAGNVAANLEALGVPTTLIGAVGTVGHRDHDLEEMVARNGTVADSKLDCRFVYVNDYRTTTKIRLVDQRGQMITRIDDELELPTTVENDILSRLHDVIEDVEPAVFVLADYDKGVLTEPVIQSVIWHGTRMCVPVIVDPVPANMYSYRNATLVTPNRAEAAQMACDHIKSKVESTADCIRMRCKTKAVLITCGESGAYLFAPTYRHREWIDAKPVPTADTTGAGDTLVAGIAAKLFDDADDILAASRYGVAAATAAVQEHGTSVVRRHEAYRAFVKEPADKVVDLQQVVLLANSAGKVGLPVVTNGVFDLIHRGHYKLLDWAATKGNFLIVLVNSDESTRRLKGDGRPVQSQDLRAEMIACHPRVDAVCIFDGDTPADALAAIGTCHLVKGPDYTIKDVVSRADVLSRGGEVSTMPTGSKTDGLSTTKTIDTVKNGD